MTFTTFNPFGSAPASTSPANTASLRSQKHLAATVHSRPACTWQVPAPRDHRSADPPNTLRLAQARDQGIRSRHHPWSYAGRTLTSTDPAISWRWSTTRLAFYYHVSLAYVAHSRSICASSVSLVLRSLDR